MATEIMTLMSDHERYTSTFAEYCKRSRKYEVLKDWVNSSFPEKVVNSLKIQNTDEIMMLGVGSGSGSVETYALKQLLTKGSKIKHTVVEPNAGLISQFKDLSAKEKDNLPGVTFDWNNKTLEEFRRDTAGQSTKYHFIMVVQILYYVDDVKEVLRYLSSKLADGGIMIIVMNSEDNCFWRVAKKYPQFKSKIQHDIYSKHVEEMLSANGDKSKTYQIDARIDSTGCFEKDSKEGELIIDFVTQVAHLKKQTPESFYNEVVDFMKTEEVSLPQTDDGKTWLRCNFDAIFVTK